MANDPLSFLGDVVSGIGGAIVWVIVLILFILLIIFVQFERFARWIGLAPPKHAGRSA